MSIQVNLRLPENLALAAQNHAKQFGYRNLQELATQALREKVLEQSEYDESFDDKEIALIEDLAELSIKKGWLKSEEELFKALEA